MIAAGIAVTCAVAAAVLTRRLGGPPPLLPLPEHQAPR
jgi:hypothetical protein